MKLLNLSLLYLFVNMWGEFYIIFQIFLFFLLINLLNLGIYRKK